MLALTTNLINPVMSNLLLLFYNRRVNKETGILAWILKVDATASYIRELESELKLAEIARETRNERIDSAEET